MSLLKKLSEKPWLAQPAGMDLPLASLDPRLLQCQTALRFFIAVVSVIFFLLSLTLLSRTQFGDFQALAGEPWQPLSDASQLWINTFFLFLGSVFLHWSYKSAAKNQLNSAIVSFSLGLFFSLLFLVGQLILWNNLMALGFFVTSNPANSFFYLLTSIHAIHLIGGLIALAYVIQKFTRGKSLSKLSNGLKLCSTYWHFLFLVWILLFALLTSSSETYKTLALLCGF